MKSIILIVALPCTLAFHVVMGVAFGLLYGYERWLHAWRDKVDWAGI